MCNSIHTCQTAIFDWLKHSICMNIKCRKESQPFFLSDFCLLDSSAVQYGQVESPNPVKYTFFIHPSAHPSPLSIDPVWSRVTGVSPELGMREKKGQFSMYCISRKNHTSRFPLGGVAIGTSETLHQLTFFELADEKCSSCFVCRSLNQSLIRSLCCRSCPADWKCHKGGVISESTECVWICRTPYRI